MKILFIETFSWAPHLEISGEIALKLKREHNDVHYHFIFSKNFDQGVSIVIPLLTLVRVFNLFRIFKKHGIAYSYSFPYFKARLEEYHFFELDEVQKYKYKGANIGLGVASTLNDLINNRKIRKKDLNKYSNRIIPNSNRVFDIAFEQINKYLPDTLYTFNTRFASSRPIYEACKLANIKINTHEAAFHPEKYSISEKSIFDGFENSKKIIKFWSEGNEGKFLISETFFKKLANAHFENNTSKDKRIDEYILSDRINLVYFPSSIHETYSLGELYPNNLFDSSEAAMDFLIEYAWNNPRINLIIRIHPIIKEKNIDEQKLWDKLFAHKHIKVVHWESTISSYDLVKRVDYSIVYHSTIGIEAAYLKKKAIVLGTPWYVSLKCVYTPSNLGELTVALDKGEIDYEFDFDDAIKYGYYVLEHGIPFEYYNPISKSKGILDGVDLSKLFSLLS
jgi:hypothetical protein